MRRLDWAYPQVINLIFTIGKIHLEGLADKKRLGYNIAVFRANLANSKREVNSVIGYGRRRRDLFVKVRMQDKISATFFVSVRQEFILGYSTGLVESDYFPAGYHK